MVAMPHDLDAEAAVLGACMVNREWRDRSLATLTADDFWKPEYRAAFRAIMALHAEGLVADHTAVLFRTEGLSREHLLTMQASAPVSLDAPLAVVGDRAARRRMVELAEQVTARATDLHSDVGQAVADLQREAETVRLPVDAFVPARDALDVLDGDDAYDWIVPRLLEAGDRIIWTAGEGIGKSELQLQLACMLASGIHPFTRTRARRISVLLVDLENSERQLRRRLRRLLEMCGDEYQGGLRVTEPRMSGIDLRDARDLRWLDRHCEQVRPELLVIGPLYKMFRPRGGEKKSDETAAEETALAIDRIRQRYGCAVSIEAHSPHGDHGDRDGFRPIGASLWMRWPEFGFGLKPIPGEKAVEVKRWRGQRDRDRDWPEKMFVGSRWPWEADVSGAAA